MYRKAMVIFAILGVSLSLILGLSSVITWQIAAVLIAVSLGIPSLILTYEEVSTKPKKRKIEEKEITTEEKDILREETIRVSPRDRYFYEFELARNDHLKGEIISTSHIDIYFVDERNFKKWEKETNFIYENCNESVLEAKIDYLVPKKGTWYLIMENNGRKSAKVKVCLY